MAYDAYGRREANGDPGYFPSGYTNVPDSSTQFPAEPGASSTSRQQPKMSAPDRAGSIGADVSPELIAAITERVKKERMLQWPYQA